MKNALTLKCVLPAVLLGAALCSAQETAPQAVSPNAAVSGATPATSGDPAPTIATTPSAVYKVGGSVQPPVVLHMVNPKFSKQARKAKFSGRVVIALVVDREGMPQNVHVLRGVGMGLDEEALNAVQQYRFKPAMQNGKPVAVYLNVEVNFQIVSRN